MLDERECIREFEKNRYDLVLFDQNIPGLDIPTFLERLDEINQLTVVAMMVTVDIERYAEQFADLNIDFMLAKPFGYHQLSKLVEETTEFSKRLKITKTYKQVS